MPKIQVVRTRAPKPDESSMIIIRSFLFECFKGATDIDDKRWRRFFEYATNKEAGEIFDVELTFPRYTPYHKRHMKIEWDVFKSQEKFSDFEMFRNWLKIGAGFVEWVAGAKGGVVPLPKSISYSELSELEFHEFHDNVIAFLRGEHAAPYLWKHLEAKSHDYMSEILAGFNE